MNSEEIIDQGQGNKRKRYFVLSEINEYNQDDNYLYLQLSEGELVLEFITSEIVRVVMGQRDKADLSTSPALVEHNLKYQDFEVEDKGDYLQVTTQDLKIKINKQKLGISFYDLDGNLIHRDYSKKALGWSKDEVRAWKELREEERFYGLGEKTGWLDKRDGKYVMWNHDTFSPHVDDTDPLYQSIPFLIGLNQNKAYGIYFDNTYKSHFDLGVGEKDYYSFWAEGGNLDYYFINGPSLKEVVDSYTTLTGKMPLPPKWSLGYHQSRYSYHPEEEVREIAQNFREKEIPCDAIHFDIHYMDEYRIFTWDENRFPNPEQLLTDLGADGFKPITIIDPGVKRDPKYDIYQEGIENDYFCKYLDGEYFIDKVWPGRCVFPDFTQQAVRDWWGDLHQRLTDVGVRGIWNDMNEPAVFNETDTMDTDVIHQNDGDLGTHDRFHNLYGFLEDQATYEGLKKHLSNERPFVLTRAGFAGIQRYSAVWTGDNRSFWDHIKLAMPMLMNLGLSGVTFSGTDVGGFTGDTSGELLARWTQLGSFVPFFRNHCEIRAIYQEPWAFAEEYESIITEYIELRYKFLTHIYNLFYQATQTGLPVMRPLVMEYQSDEETHNLSDQFMVGDSILVAPIYQPDRDRRMVYFPEGTWYDFWTGEEYEGNQHVIVDAPLDTLPLYVKAGSILPLAPVVNYVGEKDIEELNINIYLDSKVTTDSYKLYNDDGLSFNYQDGEYSLTEFTYQYQAANLEFTIDDQQTGYQEYKSYCLSFNNVASKPRTVIVDGAEVDDWNYEAQRLEVTIPAKTTKVEVKL
ncbi:family 31 glycosyl hydrolase, alpha-glucosidase [Halobacteroides halobius DSM 5150]|uniref:Family 31 glycosyl hydrolase, alpha-glucosidase n=1 Tax=Halobacteroides halobius (strain ATCC 35273 / DSM 5150 / MD-1) TaxID=748449 RepID=L0KBB9_HALHC|nr:glycoside hydrolase family 31 protein [Halobacteroides halobius]AGB41378.1 family 31 glycosyl hydrolase, alpha-glucosidase [Halobacteroides halobius DSM 5150]